MIWTMWPLPRFSISAIASCVMWKNPARLTPSTAAYSASLYCVKGFAMKTPALLMSVSIRPNCATPSAIERSAVLRSAMSPGTARMSVSSDRLIERAIATIR